MDKTPRLVDIAELADVSIGTVDRVLHNRGRVAEETRTKVLRIANELGYERNIHASILAGSRKKVTICNLIPQRGMDPFWDKIHEGLEMAGEEVIRHNVNITQEEFDLFDPADFTKKVNNIFGKAYDGLLIAPVFQREWSLLNEFLHRTHIPHVLINTLAEDEDESFLCYVGPDSYQSGRLAARLLSLHCSAGDKVIMIPLEQDFKNAHHMLEKERGFRDCFAEISPKVKVHTCEFEAYNDPQKLAAFLTKKIRKYPTLKGIYTSASRIHKMAAYFDEQDVNHIKLIGYDSLEENLKYLSSGQIHYLINQNPTLMGYLGLIHLSKFLVFKSRPPKYNYLPLDVILPENVSYYQNHYILQNKMFVPFV